MSTVDPPKSTAAVPLNNSEIATTLDTVAGLLEAQGANPFRVQAYRAAAQTVRALPQPIGDILHAEGEEGLRQLPTIGRSLAHSIAQLVDTGKLALLDRLRGASTPERIFATITGIGPELAERIHEQLAIESLTELESATYDGRLATVPGFGPKRVRGVRESLAGRLHRRPPQTPRAATPPPPDQPPVVQLLDIDDEYRRNARRLPRIAPQRFNPTHEAWLPVLHTQRGDRHFTALYSNTARAHELGMTQDWVVIYRDDADGNGQWTVITSRFGPMQGKRIVRGREAECQVHYEQQSAQPHQIDREETH
ncbi:MAG: helix-hairpin-helix domain-containing protein [Caldilineaceae bacterium]|nr:hypothetical protein [Caldilineaceae bacterium]